MVDVVWVQRAECADVRDISDDHMDLASAYSSGRMPPPVRLILETHAALNDDARAAIDDGDRVCGALLETIEPAAMKPDALSRALAAIDEIEPEAAETHVREAAKSAGAAVQELIDLPEPARSAALAAAEDGGWRFAGPGLRSMELSRDGETKAELLRIEPGVGTPHHGHAGSEMTLVLSGAFRDGDSVYARGDLCIAGPDTVHRPIAEPGAVCIALAVTDAPLEFRGALGLLQRVFRLN